MRHLLVSENEFAIVNGSGDHGWHVSESANGHENGNVPCDEFGFTSTIYHGETHVVMVPAHRKHPEQIDPQSNGAHE